MKLKSLLKLPIRYRYHRFMLPVIYLSLILLGFLLNLIYKIYPAFDITGCLNMGGQEVCTLFGIYLYTLVSLPGYIVLGSVFKYLAFQIPVLISYLLVIIVNILIYYIVWAAIRTLIKDKNDLGKLVYDIIVFTFLFLIFVCLILIGV